MRRKVASVLAIGLVAGVCSADVIVCDIVGGAATEGTWPNTETRMAVTMSELIATAQSQGYTAQYVGGGRYNFYTSTGVLEGYAIDTGGGAAAGGATSGQGLTVSHTVRQSILTPVAPGQDSEQRPRAQRNSGFRADLFYNSWEQEGVAEGYTAGLTPSILFGGETFEFTLAIPLQATSVKDGDTSANVGADLAMRIWLCDYVSIGGHASYLLDIRKVDDGSDEKTETSGAFNGGPFVSVKIPLGGVGVLSAAALYENFRPDEGDTISELALAANLGIFLGRGAALNVFGIRHQNTDSDLSDLDYDEAGAELQFGGGGSWAFTVGARTVLGIDNYTSNEGYIGSEWRW